MTIKTERLLLRPFEFSDSEDIFEYSQNENVGKNAGWQPPETLEESIEIMNSIFIDKENVYAIEFCGKVIGSIALMSDHMRENQKSLMIGYAIGEPYWGQGLMTEACKAVIDYVFSQLEIDILSITCYSDNPRSERVVTKCGFEFEGMLHSATVLYNGDIKDKRCFFLTREMYLKQNLVK